MKRPTHHARPRRAIALLAAAVAFAAAVYATPAASPPTSAAAPVAGSAETCTGWESRTEPPATIRVLRTTGPSAGSVEVAPFREYVNVVMASEWGPSNPTEALRAGAVAVKEYAWYRAMVWRGRSADDGSCYDVVDSTIDQVYSPETRTPAAALVDAVDVTWGVRVLREGRLFATHYEGGGNVACASDADGRRLFQNSAMRCARDGMTFDAILAAYYFPDVEISLGGGPDPSPSPGLPADPTLALTASAPTITWGQDVALTVALAMPDAGTAAGRTVRLERSADRVAWTAVADLVTDATGSASLRERPDANAWYRASFDDGTGAPPFASPVVRVVVRRTADLQAGSGGSVRRVARGTSVTATVVVRPTAGVAAGDVSCQLLRLVGKQWVVSRSWTVTPDAAGRARIRVTLAVRGSWRVRASGLATSSNARSAWAYGPRYDVP